LGRQSILAIAKVPKRADISERKIRAIVEVLVVTMADGLFVDHARGS
jgi:hypothetical protein